MTQASSTSRYDTGFSVRALDGEGRFEGYASVFDVATSSGHLIERGAFARTLAERGAAGVKLLWQHDTAQPIGVWEELREDERGLYARGRLLLDLQQGHEAHVLLKSGAIDGLSIGFVPVYTEEGGEGVEHVVDAELIEISIVTLPANPEARIRRVQAQVPDEKPAIAPSSATPSAAAPATNTRPSAAASAIVPDWPRWRDLVPVGWAEHAVTGSKALSYLLGATVVVLAGAVHASGYSVAQVIDWSVRVLTPPLLAMIAVLSFVSLFAWVKQCELAADDARQDLWLEIGRHSANAIAVLALTYKLLGIALGIGSLATTALTPSTIQAIIRELTANFSLAFQTTVIGLPIATAFNALLWITRRRIEAEVRGRPGAKLPS